MKVLIIGKDSYIGNHIDEWLTSKGYHVDQLDVLAEEWKSFDYSQYETIVHVAGIVHRPDCNDWGLYKTVNVDMPTAIASMAKKQGGTKSYVFFSTMAVYGLDKELSPTIIDKNTALKASTMYGKSKLLAEEYLMQLQGESFNVVCVRPPSVYGRGCKGNYIPGFIKVVKHVPIFPLAYLNVKQSMLYVDNLCEFVYLAIVNNARGAFCPQDEEPVNAIEILDAISSGMGIKRVHSKLLGILVHLLSFVPIVRKAYGGVEYTKDLSKCFDGKYRVVDFKEGIRRTVSI